jgi:F0F1-type ATP synthase membrane subunit c/vacuolar-type H+-ATPase subunit K
VALILRCSTLLLLLLLLLAVLPCCCCSAAYSSSLGLGGAGGSTANAKCRVPSLHAADM